MSADQSLSDAKLLLLDDEDLEALCEEEDDKIVRRLANQPVAV